MRFAAYVVYYEDDKTRLIRDSLIPAALTMGRRPGVESVYLQRHWKYGPHVRLCVRASDPALKDAVDRTELELVRSFLARHPSEGSLDENEYRRNSEALGTLELDPPPYEPLWSDNTVHVGEYDPRGNLLGGDLALAFKEAFLDDALGPMLAFLQRTNGSDALRPAYVLNILTVLAESLPKKGILRGHMSLKSHLEDFLFDYDRGGRLRDAFEKRYRTTQERAMHNLGVVLNDTADGRYVGDDPLLREWSELFERGWEKALALAEQGEIREDPAPEQFQAAQSLPAGARDAAIKKYVGDPARTSYSPFHTELQKLNYMPARVNVVPFSAYRWLVNLVYSILPVLGVSPMERYYLCYVLTEATYAHFDVRWEEVFESIRSEWPRDL